jgi:hypothetical protein
MDKPHTEDVMTAVYLYETRTPVIALTVETKVSLLLAEKVTGEKGSCESQASLACDLGDPGAGVWRILPESLLADGEPEYMFQCLPCFEASAEALLRKSTGAV